MSGKSLFKKLISEVEQSATSTHNAHIKENLKKQNSLIQYKRMQYMNAGKTLSKDEDNKLVEGVKASMASLKPKIDQNLL